MERKESDQLPEEGPAEQVPDDAEEKDREGTGGGDGGERHTGHPDESDES
jgi:hypothetical protein